MPLISLGLLSLILGYAAFRWGGVLPADWYPCLAAIGLTTALYAALSRSRDRTPSPPWILRLLPPAVLALAVLQIVPLPLGLVRRLSPARAELAEALGPVLGEPARVTLSVQPEVTFLWVLTLASALLVFFLVRDLAWRWREHPWILVIPVVIIALLEAVLGLIQRYGFGLDLARGTYVNRNHFSGLLEMTLPFAVMYGVALLNRGRTSGTRRAHRTPAGPALKACVWLSIATVMLVAVIHSLSRMGFLATLSALFVMGAVSLGGNFTGKKRWFPIIAVGIIVFTGFVFLPTDQLIQRFATFAQTEDISSDTRAEIWSDTTKLIRAFPLTGSGLGAYESGLYQFKTVAPMNSVVHAHNDYLQALAEFGIPGFVLLMILAVRTFVLALRSSEQPAGTGERHLAIACTGALTAIALHSLVDFNLYIPANALLLVWIAGATEGLAFISLPFEHRRRSKHRSMPVYIEANASSLG